MRTFLGDIALRDIQIDVQKEAMPILKERKIVYLVLETRVGKTYAALFIAYNYGARNILFITKKKSVSDIDEQAEALRGYMDIDVTNYEQTHKYQDEYDLYIVDEAHNLGTFPKASNRQKKVRRLTYYKPIIFLSATPTPESWSGLYHQLDLSRYSPWSRYAEQRYAFYRWADMYVDKYQKRINKRFVNKYDRAKEDKIDKQFNPLRIARTKKEAEFSYIDIKESTLDVEMSDYTHILFKTVLEKAVIQGADEVLADSAVKLQNKLHQIASGSIITDANNYIVTDRSKAIAIQRDMHDRGITKAAIFYKFVSEKEIIKSIFPNTYTDSTKFQKAKSGVFLGQVIASREGIKLDTSDILYMMNIDFAWLSYEQAKNRVQAKHKDIQPELVWVIGDTNFELKVLKTVRKKEKYNVRHFSRDFL